MHYQNQMLTTVIALVSTIVFATGAIALNIIDPPPMTGYITDKDHHPAYYPVDSNTPEVYVLAITDVAGRRCVSWVVSKERWELYSVGDIVNWIPKLSKEGS